jgi:hypothetical protein
MHRWGKWDTDQCQHCGLPEEASHLALCKGMDMKDLWQYSLNSLQEWLDSAQTDPDIAISIPPFPTSLSLLDQQSDIGWNLLIEGWVVFE